MDIVPHPYSPSRALEARGPIILTILLFCMSVRYVDFGSFLMDVRLFISPPETYDALIHARLPFMEIDFGINCFQDFVEIIPARP